MAMKAANRPGIVSTPTTTRSFRPSSVFYNPNASRSLALVMQGREQAGDRFDPDHDPVVSTAIGVLPPKHVRRLWVLGCKGESRPWFVWANVAILQCMQMIERMVQQKLKTLLMFGIVYCSHATYTVA